MKIYWWVSIFDNCIFCWDWYTVKRRRFSSDCFVCMKIAETASALRLSVKTAAKQECEIQLNAVLTHLTLWTTVVCQVYMIKICLIGRILIITDIDHFSQISRMGLWMAKSVGWSTPLVKTDISHQLLDGLQRNLVQIFMFHVSWQLISLFVFVYVGSYWILARRI